MNGRALAYAGLVLAIVLVLFLYQGNQASELRRNQVETCERVNLVRAAVREHLQSTLAAGAVFDASSKSPEVRAFFKSTIPDLQSQLANVHIVECERLIR